MRIRVALAIAALATTAISSAAWAQYPPGRNADGSCTGIATDGHLERNQRNDVAVTGSNVGPVTATLLGILSAQGSQNSRPTVRARLAPGDSFMWVSKVTPRHRGNSTVLTCRVSAIRPADFNRANDSKTVVVPTS